MVSVAAVHSFRGGTGKSNLSANLAVHLAGRGLRVGVIDTDVQSPGIHVLFGLVGASITASLNDYLFDGKPMAEVTRDVTPDGVAGAIHLIPSSVKPGEITRILREGYDAQRLVAGLRAVVDELDLEVLLIDTHPGLGEETLLSLVVSDTVLVVMRPDHQDYEGTGIVLDVAAGLEVPRTALVVNKVPPNLSTDDVRIRVEASYGSPVVAVLPHDDDMIALASGGVFSLVHPDHPITDRFAEVAEYLMNP